MVPRLGLVLDPEAGKAACAGRIGADEVDRAVLRRRHQPRLWTLWDAAGRPGLDGTDHGIGQSLLGEVEVVELRRESGEQPPVVLAPDGGEDQGGVRPGGVHQ